MYSVLIAEDELLVRIGIASSVPWAQMGMRVVAEAADGASAWEAFLRYRPDIVIADIRMPQMDGLELIRRIRAEDSGCAILIVTNVEHDGALEEARRMGIADYLLKAVMKPDDIMQAVLRARAGLPGGRGAPQCPMDNDALWREFLSAREMDGAAFRRRCERFHAAFFAPQGFVALRILPSEQLSHRLQTSLTSLFAHRREIAGAFFVLSLENGAVALAKEAFDPDAVARGLESLAQYVRDNFGERLRFVVQAGGAELDVLRDRLEAAFRYATQDWYFARAALILDAEGKPCLPALEAAARTLRRCAPLSPQMRELFQCADDAGRLREQIAANGAKAQKLGARLLERLGESPDFSNVSELAEAVARAAEQISRSVRLSVREELLAAVDYIESHLSQKISIRDVSEAVGYHPAYFSSLFKKEMGASYSDFLTNLRIYRAKELLQQTNLSVQEVADACGFSDLSYFSYKFKHIVGNAPSEWRMKR